VLVPLAVGGALLGGAAVGLLLGLLGGGGSVLTVPILVYGFDVPAYAATSVSLVVVGVAAVVGAVAHDRAGRLRRWDAALFVVLGAPGAWLGVHLAGSVPERVLLGAFAVLMAVSAAGMWARARRASALPGDPDLAGPAAAVATALSCPLWSRCWQLKLARTVAAALAVGLLTGFLGVGGGFLVVPALVTAVGVPMRSAVGTSLAVISGNAALALGLRAMGPGLLLGAEDMGALVAVVVPFVLAAVAGTLIGSRLSARVPAQRLTQAFSLLLLGTAAYVLLSA